MTRCRAIVLIATLTLVTAARPVPAQIGDSTQRFRQVALYKSIAFAPGLAIRAHENCLCTGIAHEFFLPLVQRFRNFCRKLKTFMREMNRRGEQLSAADFP